MRKFLYNLNSTSWFYTFKNGKLLKLEVFLLLMIAATFLGGIGTGYEHQTGAYFGIVYQILVAPFWIFILEYLLYFLFAESASIETQEYYWKSQLWRLKNKGHIFQKKLMYPNWEYKLEELSTKWEYVTGQTPDETIKNAPLIQKLRGGLLLVAALAGVIVGNLIGIILG